MNISIAGRLLVATALLTLTAPAFAQSNAMTAQERANLQMVLDWWRECIEGRHLDLTTKYQSDDYIQHNINVPTGRAGFVEFFSRLGGPVNPIPAKLSNPPVIQFAKGDFVLLVWEREGKDPADASKTYKYNTYDLLRIENGKVQEHWDYALKMPGGRRGAAPDGTNYDALKFDFSAAEQKNIEIANGEFKDILQYGHLELAEKYMAPTYIQHNPNVLRPFRQARADQARVEEQADDDSRERAVRALYSQADATRPGLSEYDVSGLLVRSAACRGRHDPGALGFGDEESAAGTLKTRTRALSRRFQEA